MAFPPHCGTIIGTHWAPLEVNEVRSALPLLDSHSLPHPDSCKWTLTRNGQFIIHSLWNHTRIHYPLVNWSHIDWFPSRIPKCSLISWLAIQNRLSTEDRLVLFGIKDSSYCSFCSGVENHDHLFFRCHYTKQVWDLVSLKSQFTWQPQSVSNLVHLLSHTRVRKLKATLTKLTFTVTIYHIWIWEQYEEVPEYPTHHPIFSVENLHWY